MDHWAFQGSDDEEEDDASLGDRHVWYFSDDEAGGGGYGSDFFQTMKSPNALSIVVVW